MRTKGHRTGRKDSKKKAGRLLGLPLGGGWLGSAIRREQRALGWTREGCAHSGCRGGWCDLGPVTEGLSGVSVSLSLKNEGCAKGLAGAIHHRNDRWEPRGPEQMVLEGPEERAPVARHGPGPLAISRPWLHPPPPLPVFCLDWKNVFNFFFPPIVTYLAKS